MVKKIEVIKERISPFISFIIKLVKSILLLIGIFILSFGGLIALILIFLKYNKPYELAFVIYSVLVVVIMWHGFFKAVPEALAETSAEQKRKSIRNLAIYATYSIIWTWFLVISIFAWIYYIHGGVEGIYKGKLEITPQGNQTWNVRFEYQPGIAYLKYLYFSSVVITTLGDPHYTPKGTTKIIAIVSDICF